MTPSYPTRSACCRHLRRCRPQGIWHLPESESVQYSLVVLVALELLPRGFGRMRQYDALIVKGAGRFRAGVVAFLRRGQQRMQHLDRRLEHLDELEKPLGRAVEDRKSTRLNSSH